MRISDWSSDVCSSDLGLPRCGSGKRRQGIEMFLLIDNYDSFTYNLYHYLGELGAEVVVRRNDSLTASEALAMRPAGIVISPGPCDPERAGIRSEEHTSELQSLMRISYAVFCLKKKKKSTRYNTARRRNDHQQCTALIIKL